MIGRRWIAFWGTARQRTALGGLVLCVVVGCSELRAPELPALSAAAAAPAPVFLDQNWTPEQWATFHTLSQGTVTLPVPYDWLVAFEAPGLFEQELLVSPDYLRRFGFFYDPAAGDRAAGEPDGHVALPVGFARVRAPRDPASGAAYYLGADGRALDGVGFTCAACHTGEVHYRGQRVRIEGGPALTDLGKFRKAVGLALLYTAGPPQLPFNPLPFRFRRFAARVLGPAYTSEQADALKAALRARLAALAAEREARAAQVPTGDVLEGFGRIDAIGRIGDQVFGASLTPRNYAPLEAPVSYPPIWHASWFTWVQYNGSIRQPMVRNAGEALGVSALINLRDPSRELFASTIDFENLVVLEELLSGDAPFDGLTSPPWPEQILGAIDRDSPAFARGRELYADLCQKCHLAPARELARARPGPHWVEVASATRSDLYLDVRHVPLRAIGTDPAMAQRMHDRFVSPGDLELASAQPTVAGAAAAGPCNADPAPREGRAPFGRALAEVTEAAITHFYDAKGFSTEERDRMNGFRPAGVRASLCYKARPLDGVWATAPYLHNGSVPNLYLMLTDEAERDRVTAERSGAGREGFYVGSREFDPERVGLEYGELDGATFVDTALPGNLNSGHEFSDQQGPGVVGPALRDADRSALILYLKSL